MHEKTWLGYGAALLLPVLALSMRTIFQASPLGQAQLSWFVISIALSACLGGLAPGIMASLLSLLLVNYYVLAPLHEQQQLTALSLDVSLTLLLAGVFCSVLIGVLHRQQRRLRSLQRSAALRAEQQRASEDLLSTVFHSAPVAIMIVRRSDGHLVDVNSAFSELWGYARHEALGRSAGQLGLWVQPAQLTQRLKQNRPSGAQELQIRHRCGQIRDVIASVILIQLGGEAHLLVTAADVTERRRALELEHLAHHDLLTNLPNRLLLRAKLREARERAAADGTLNAVLFIDLDHFKEVNDNLGHDAGDELLRLVAARLKGRSRLADTVARIGGDEFVVLLEQLHEAKEAELIARELVLQMSTPFTLSRGREVQIGASIGISYFSADFGEVELLLQQADAALYEAKSAGRNTVRVFEKRAVAVAV